MAPRRLAVSCVGAGGSRCGGEAGGQKKNVPFLLFLKVCVSSHCRFKFTSSLITNVKSNKSGGSRSVNLLGASFEGPLAATK